jgi:hypothetical protein
MLPAGRPQRSPSTHTCEPAELSTFCGSQTSGLPGSVGGVGVLLIGV